MTVEIVIAKANGTHTVNLIATRNQQKELWKTRQKKTKTRVIKNSYLGLNLLYTLLDVIHHFAPSV